MSEPSQLERLEKTRRAIRRLTRPLAVLLVEDNEMDAELQLLELAPLRASVTVARTANAALAHLKCQPAELMILDLRLPDGNGAEVFRDAQTLLPDLLILVASGLPLESPFVELVRKNGAEFIYEKPVSTAQLTEITGLEV